jgi:hypothetical protein
MARRYLSQAHQTKQSILSQQWVCIFLEWYCGLQNKWNKSLTGFSCKLAPKAVENRWNYFSSRSTSNSRRDSALDCLLLARLAGAAGPRDKWPSETNSVGLAAIFDCRLRRSRRWSRVKHWSQQFKFRAFIFFPQLQKLRHAAPLKTSKSSEPLQLVTGPGVWVRPHWITATKDISSQSLTVMVHLPFPAGLGIVS